MITTSEIRKQFKQTWPDLKFIILTDQNYLAPAAKQVEEFFINSETKTLPLIPKLFECEEVALSLVAELRRKRLTQWLNKEFPIDELYNWAFGFAWGNRFDGIVKNHWTNICVTEDWGLILLDVQAMRIWQPSKVKDEIIFIWM